MLDINNEAAGIEQDNRKLVTNFNGFEKQLHRIDEFQDRIDAGKEKLANLQERIGSVKQEIDAWDHKEGEWQARVTRRLRLLWAAMGILLFAVLLAVTIDEFRPALFSGLSKAGNMMWANDSVNLSTPEDSLGQGVCPTSPRDRYESGVCRNMNDRVEMKPGIASQSPDASMISRPGDEEIQRVIDEL